MWNERWTKMLSRKWSRGKFEWSCEIVVCLDEYANSGEDSDEDVVTDYTNPNCNHASCLTGMSLCAGNAVDSDYAKDNAVIKMSNNERTDGQASQGGSGMQQQPQHQTNPLVPIISVTPHSPGISNKYLILGMIS